MQVETKRTPWRDESRQDTLPQDPSSNDQDSRDRFARLSKTTDRRRLIHSSPFFLANTKKERERSEGYHILTNHNNTTTKRTAQEKVDPIPSRDGSELDGIRTVFWIMGLRTRP